MHHVCLTIFSFFLVCRAWSIHQETGPKILHFHGSPYELGYQHGTALKEAIAYNVKRLVEDRILANPEHPQIKSFLFQLSSVTEHVPQDYLDELKGLADGAAVSFEKILILNLFPEMFHCTGLTVSGNASRDKRLYHVRVLDYAVGSGLQDSAVLMIVKPDGKIPFANLSYAGFIGSVTGMNLHKISVGEIGGKGYGQHAGVPMAFLLRKILEEAGTLDEAKLILSSARRTCEYFYVISDGNSKQSIGAYAAPTQLQWIQPGETYALFNGAAVADRPGSNEKIVRQQAMIESNNHQTLIYEDDQSLFGLIHDQPAGCLALTGFSHPERYPILVERLVDIYGKIGVTELMEVIKSPVARPGNLHNAIFSPETLDMWFSHAGLNGEAACDQEYHHVNLQWLKD